MNALVTRMLMFWNDITSTDKEKGATGTEYALLIAFVALVLIGGATLFGQALSAWFTALAGKIGGWATAP